MFDLIPWRKKKNNELAERKNEMGMLFDKFFDDPFFSPMKSLSETALFPKVDVSEGKKDITVKAEIPGMEPKEIDVSIDGRLLTIRGEKKREKEEKNESYHRIERSFGQFHRTIELPAEVDDAKVDASYKKGVLKIVMKKTGESETKKIKVKTTN